jgi:NAD(P)-dependent dehydrogenase (short-subunit alcohol dehydrogenase family)
MGEARLSGKVAIVTGGASGIGRALGEELAKRGAEVVMADRQAGLADEVAWGINDRGGKARAAELDVRSAAAFKALADDTVARSGRIDFLFNNAGIAVGGELEGYSIADYDEVFDVNLRGVAYGIHAVYPVMIAQHSGHIVNTASVAGLVTAGMEGSYGASKHAVVGLTKALRMEGRRHGVRASALCPGAIRTPILTGGKFGRMNLMRATPQKIMEFWERFRPMEPAALAEKAIDAVLRNQAIIVLPRWWKAFWYLERISPDLSMKFLGMMLERFRAELEEHAAAQAKQTNGQGETSHAEA